MINFLRTYSGVELIVVSLAFILVILIALTIHEVAHSYVAFTQGDVTSKYFGRLSLNPAKHIDPIGFICLLLFGFGWAKPVPINTVKFKNYRKGIFLTSIAGVCANFILSFISVGLLAFMLKFVSHQMIVYNYFYKFLYHFLTFSATINLGLAIFNLLPIPPLDGFNVLTSLTKGNNKVVNFLVKYGFIILLAVLLFGIIDVIFSALYGVVIPAFTNFWQFIF